MVISIASTYIKYLSPSTNGKIHDFNLLKKMFDPSINWFEKFNVKLDSGYTGFGKIYTCKAFELPYKKSKNTPLSDDKKQFNKELSSKRVVVEHCIGRMKRYHVLSNRLRMHDIDLYDKILGVCAGLWNFYLSN